jgi:hypothetical protein
MYVAYVGGKYRAKTEWEIIENIRIAEDIAAQLWDIGFAVICPHKNTAHLGGIYGLEDQTWIDGYLEILKRCDVLVVAPNWRNSSGTNEEIRCAAEHSIPIFYWGDGDNLGKLKEFSLA